MLLLFSSKNERFTSLIEEQLNDSDIFKFNLDAASLKKSIVTIINNELIIEQNNKSINISQISGVWVKRQSMLVTSEEEQSYCGFTDYCNYKLWKDEWNSIIKQIIAHLSFMHVTFFDEPELIISAERKLLQLDIARAIGFNTPSTIVSNSKLKIIEFLNHHNGEGILKLSTQPAFNMDSDVYFIYANKVSLPDFDEMDTMINSPFIVQNYIKKKYEVRYTYVNDEHFVCKIESQLSDKSKIDFRRYDFANTPYSAIDAPEEIKGKVSRFMHKLSLNYGALDFIVDENDKWHFLEINPVGQYGWIEHLTGLPITAAILNYLFQKQII